MLRAGLCYERVCVTCGTNTEHLSWDVSIVRVGHSFSRSKSVFGELGEAMQVRTKLVVAFGDIGVASRAKFYYNSYTTELPLLL